MLERSVLARWLLLGGAALLVISLVLWWALPISMTFPPYLFTSLLALGYGGFLLKSRPPAGRRKPLA